MESKKMFYLKTKENQLRYPSNLYPLTHAIDFQICESKLSNKASIIFKLFIFVFPILLGILLFFSTHIHLMNAIFGPYHLNQQEFIKYAKDFKTGKQSWFNRIEYIQIELGENSVQTSTSNDATIRRYANPFHRYHHIATYKRMKKYKNVFIKLPTKFVPQFHSEFPFDFSKFSVKTLQCIWRTLLSSKKSTINSMDRLFAEKSEYIKYIKNEYSQNSTLFNMQILTKCGIFIGFLYKPLYDKAFVPKMEYEFHEKDIAFETTKPYLKLYLQIIYSFLYFWLFLHASFYAIKFLIKQFRIKFFDGFPLIFNEDVQQELWLLNLNTDEIVEQLLKLDELILQSSHKFSNQIFIIENETAQLFVVLLPVKLGQIKGYENHPFIICPVSQIRKITFDGIFYFDKKKEFSLDWPPMESEEEQEEIVQWLHLELLEISPEYQTQYQNLIHQTNTKTSVYRRRWNLQENFNSKPDTPLNKLIQEEKNIKKFKIQRLSIYGLFEDFLFGHSPSSKFIAKFRLQQECNLNLVNEEIENEKIECVICLNELKLNETYSIWPCQSTTPHRFHYECILKQVRMDKKCPLCRQRAIISSH